MRRTNLLGALLITVSHFLHPAITAAVPENLSAIVPLQPFCDPFYGTFQGRPMRCAAALALMPDGRRSKFYEIRPPGTRPMGYSLPAHYVDVSTNCDITIEIAGPTLPPFVELVPHQLNVQATSVVQTCTVGGMVSQWGGFLVQRMDLLQEYVADLRVNLDDAYHTSFVTVTVSTLDKPELAPGNFDPEIPSTLAVYTGAIAQGTGDPYQRSLLAARAEHWQLRAQQMYPRSLNRRISWWQDPYDATTGQASNDASTVEAVASLSPSLQQPNLTDVETS
ncbi:MAG: hypothetical protein Q9222_002133 [Ikaeria aurantiellina]